MKQSGDQAIGRSGRKSFFTAATPRHGEGDAVEGHVCSNCVLPMEMVSGYGFAPAVVDQKAWALAPVFRQLVATIRATLREIFDESAYDRFLRQTRVAASRESYRAFLRERESEIAQKPRCC